MKENDTVKFKRLSNVESPCPKRLNTVDTIESNGHYSILKKEDGTFCLKNEQTGDENGSFLTKIDAKAFLTSIIDDENEEI